MTAKTRADLIAEADANLPDNTTEQISPADIRELIKNAVESVFNILSDDASLIRFSYGAGSPQTYQQVDEALRAALDSSGFTAATQAEMEAASSTTVGSTPGRQHFHPGHPKFWAFVTYSGGVPTLVTSYNVTSITDTATGQLTVTIATDFSSADWAALAGFNAPTPGSQVWSVDATQSAGSVLVTATLSGTGLADVTSLSVSGLGDQA